jgi:hypothetical protein
MKKTKENTDGHRSLEKQQWHVVRIRFAWELSTSRQRLSPATAWMGDPMTGGTLGAVVSARPEDPLFGMGVMCLILD